MFFVDIAAPNTPPSISSQPLSQTIGAGQTATLAANLAYEMLSLVALRRRAA